MQLKWWRYFCWSVLRKYCSNSWFFRIQNKAFDAFSLVFDVMATFIAWMLFAFIDLNHHFKSILHAQITSLTIVNAREKIQIVLIVQRSVTRFVWTLFNLISFLSSFFQVYTVLFIFISRFLLNFLFVHSSELNIQNRNKRRITKTDK